MGITLLVTERAPKFSSSILIRDTLNINLRKSSKLFYLPGQVVCFSSQGLRQST